MSIQNAALLTDEATYLGREEELAYESSISNLRVGERTTGLQFHYKMPKQQSAHGKVRIWNGLTVPASGDPFYEAPLPISEYPEGSDVSVSTAATTFNRGAFVISVSVDGNVNSIAATTPLFNGQPVGGGGSSILVISKLSESITTVFTNPPNISAGSQLEYAAIYEGKVPGVGTILASARAPQDDNSGVITVPFKLGTLVSGKWYNVCLNSGPSYTPFAAAYVFKYLPL
jgi:hypothetical protein